MPRPDNWNCLVPLWLRPIFSFTAWVFIFYGFVWPMWLLCGTMETWGGSCKVHTVRSSLPECFLVAMLNSVFHLFSVFLSQTSTLYFLPETCPAPDIIQNQTRTPCSLFHISQLLCLHVCVYVCVRVSVFGGIGDCLWMCVSVPKWGTVREMCVWLGVSSNCVS